MKIGILNRCIHARVTRPNPLLLHLDGSPVMEELDGYWGPGKINLDIYPELEPYCDTTEER